MEIVRCIHCGQKPHLVMISDMLYARCKCGKWNPYAFVGISKRTTLGQWNDANTPPEPNKLIHVKRKKYIYYIGERELDIESLAKYVDVSISYIKLKFRRCRNNRLGYIMLKGIKIERKEIE